MLTPSSKIPAGAVLCVVGARPNYMKIAPIIRALRSEPGSIPAKLVHTGQHYDKKMSGDFFEQLNIPEPDENLGGGGGTFGDLYLRPATSRTIVNVPADILNTLPAFKISSFALSANAFLPLIVTAPPDCLYFKIPAEVDGLRRT